MTSATHLGGEVLWGWEGKGPWKEGKLGVRLTGRTSEHSLSRPFLWREQVPRPGWRETMETRSLTVWRLEAQNQVTSGPHPSDDSRGASFLASPSFWWPQAALGSRLHHSDRCLRLRVALSQGAHPSHGLPSAYVCPDSPLPVRTPVTGWELTRTQYNFIVTRLNLQRPSP